MPGEHFCTYCEENVSKHKGTYTKLCFDNFDPEDDEIINVVCPACREKDKALDKVLTTLENISKPVETFKGARKCIFCGERIKRREKSLRAEFRYNGCELRADVCKKCLEGDDYPVLKEAKPKKANPKFDVTIVCAAADVCESFKTPGRNRGINCGNVCVNIEGELYCRRAHPGTVKIYRERWALPPSKREMLKIWRDIAPMMKNFKEGKMLQRNIDAIIEAKREELQALEEGGVAIPQAIYDLPETKTWEIRSYSLEPFEGNERVTTPFFAMPLSIDYSGPLPSMKFLVPVGKKEEKEEGDLQVIEVQGSGLGGPTGLDWVGYTPLTTGVQGYTDPTKLENLPVGIPDPEKSEITGDLYSSCPECGSMDTRFTGTVDLQAEYECNKCGHTFHPKIFRTIGDP